MAKFTPGPLADGLQGKVSGLVFRAGGAGRVVSGAPSVTRAPSRAQSFQRMAFAAASHAWTQCTASQKTAWYTFAFSSAPPTNSFGAANWGAARPAFLRWYVQAFTTGTVPWPLFPSKPPYVTPQFFEPLRRDGAYLFAAAAIADAPTGLAVWAADCGPAALGQVPARLLWKPIYLGALDGPTVWLSGGIHAGLKWVDMLPWFNASPFAERHGHLFLVRGSVMVAGVSVGHQTAQNLYWP